MEPNFEEVSALSDDELNALALAADPGVAVDPTMTPWLGAWASGPLLIPEWYMPRPSSSSRRRGALIVIGVILAGFITIDAFGLCITSGFLSLA